MARARICLDCGHDFGAAPPWREPHYGLLVCTCPGCGRVWPAPRRPRALRRALAPWLSLAKGAALAFFVLLFLLGTTGISESMLGSFDLDTEQIITPGGLRNLSERLPLALRDTLHGDLALLSALFARMAGGFVLGLWVTSRTETPRRARRACAMIVLGVTGFVLLSLSASLLDHGPLPWHGWHWQLASTVAVMFISGAFAPLGMLARGTLDRLRVIARRSWFRRRLARARFRRTL